MTRAALREGPRTGRGGPLPLLRPTACTDHSQWSFGDCPKPSLADPSRDQDAHAVAPPTLPHPLHQTCSCVDPPLPFHAPQRRGSSLGLETPTAARYRRKLLRQSKVQDIQAPARAGATY
eukprot:7307642-Pyramimonas_sp.AAC.1